MRAPDNDVAEGPARAVVRIAVAAVEHHDDAALIAGGPDDVVVRIADNDAPGLVITVMEGAASAATPQQSPGPCSS